MNEPSDWYPRYNKEYKSGDPVTWMGSRLAAPGPGERYRNKFGFDQWDLFGEILRVSPVDPQSIKIRWANGRVTIERASNISHPIVMASA